MVPDTEVKVNLKKMPKLLYPAVINAAMSVVSWTISLLGVLFLSSIDVYENVDAGICGIYHYADFNVLSHALSISFTISPALFDNKKLVSASSGRSLVVAVQINLGSLSGSGLNFHEP